MIQDADGLFEIFFLYADDDVEFLRPLRNHADVHAVFTEFGEDLTGNAGPVGHLAADGGDDGDMLRYSYLIRLHFLLQLAQHFIERAGYLVGRDDEGNIVDAGGQIFDVDLVLCEHVEDLQK